MMGSSQRRSNAIAPEFTPGAFTNVVERPPLVWWSSNLWAAYVL